MSDGQALAQVTFAGSGELTAKITPAGEASTTDVMPYVFSDVQSYDNLLDLSADDVSAFGLLFTSTLRTLSEFGVVTRGFNIDGELFSRARDPEDGTASTGLTLTISLLLDEPFEVNFLGSFRSGNPSGIGGTVTFDAFGIAESISGGELFEVTEVLEPGEYQFDLDLFTGGNEESEISPDLRFVFRTAEPESLYWSNAAGGQFSDATNWIPEFSPATGDNILFDLISNGYIVEMDQDAQVKNATIEQGTVSWRFSGNPGNNLDIADDLTVGTMPNIRAGLDVIGGTVDPDNVNIGTSENANALVTLRENAVLDPIGNVNVGGGANAEAQLFIISGSTLKLDEGENLNITGPDSTVTADELSIGTTDLGGGVINVTQGAKLKVNGDLDILDSDLNVSNAESLVTVAGGNAQFTAGSRVNISDGGRMVSDTLLAENINLLINSTGLTDEDVGVTVSGAGSRLAGWEDVAIGTVSSAEVEVLNGGELLTLGEMVLGGVGNETYGDLLVRGAGSVVLAGAMQLFSTGEALSVLEIDAGGVVTLPEDLHVNNSRVIVSGADSKLEVYNNFVIRGGAEATLEVTNGGALLNPADLEDFNDGAVFIFDSIAPDSSPDGNVLIGGTIVSNDSRIRTLGNIRIGDESNGYVLVESSSDIVTLGVVTLGNGSNGTSGYLVIDEGSEFGAGDLIVGADEGPSSLFRVSDSSKAYVYGSLEVRRTGVVQTESDGSIVVGLLAEDYSGPRENYLVVASDGELTGSGSIETSINTLGGVVNLGGNITPGSSPGALTIDGNFIQGEEGTTTFEIAGMTAGEEYDQLIVTGNAELDGNFIIDFIDGFAPSAGDTFDLLPVTGETTVIAALPVEVRGLKEGFEFDFALSDTGNVFSFTALTDGILAGCDPPNELVGDIDGDGTVGFNDFLVLSENYGDSGNVTYQDGDLDCDGTIAFTDFLSLAANFGQSLAGPVQSVPEPEVGWIAFAIMGAWSASKRRRRAMSGVDGPSS